MPASNTTINIDIDGSAQSTILSEIISFDVEIDNGQGDDYYDGSVNVDFVTDLTMNDLPDIIDTGFGDYTNPLDPVVQRQYAQDMKNDKAERERNKRNSKKIKA